MSTPFEFQELDIRQLHRWGGRGLLSWEQGLGKTFGAMYFAYRNPAARPAVIVCPMSVKYNWAREGLEHFGYRVEVLEGTNPGAFDSRAPFYCVNYDILGKRHSEKSGPGWIETLRKLDPRLVVVDECQYVANVSSRRTRWLRELCKNVPHVVALSGTPLTNRPAELWPILNIVRPGLFPSRWGFLRRYCSPKRTPWGWDVSGSSNLEELNKILTDPEHGCLLRRRKCDVLKDLPAKTRTLVPLPLSRPKEYALAVKDFRSWLTIYAPGKSESALRAQALTRIGYLKRLCAELKLQAAFAWLDDYLSSGDGKIIVFGVHSKVLLPTLERYGNAAVLVDGSVTGRARQEAVDRFNRDPSCRMLVGNIRAAGTGWSARDCSVTAFLELDWTPGAHAQAEDRTHGIARGREGYASQSIYLLARGTVEEKLAELLRRKQEVLNAVLDAGDGDDLDLVSELLSYLDGESE